MTLKQYKKIHPQGAPMFFNLAEYNQLERAGWKFSLYTTEMEDWHKGGTVKRSFLKIGSPRGVEVTIAVNPYLDHHRWSVVRLLRLEYEAFCAKTREEYLQESTNLFDQWVKSGAHGTCPVPPTPDIRYLSP